VGGLGDVGSKVLPPLQFQLSCRPATVDSATTNGTVPSAARSGGAKQIVVTYGKQVVLVPPTASIVTYQLGDRAELKPGTAVFINAVSRGHNGCFTKFHFFTANRQAA
jgi:hypothetical protein